MAIERRALIGLIVAFTASIIAFPMFPPDIPPQVGRDGVFIGAPFVAFLLPVAAMAVWWIVANLSRHPPRATPRPTNAGAATALFLSAFHVTMLMAFIGGQPWLVRMLGVLVGVFLVATGNDLPRVRPNLAWGVRMRQTLASDSLWRRVHRLAGFIRVADGNRGVRRFPVRRTGRDERHRARRVHRDGCLRRRRRVAGAPAGCRLRRPVLTGGERRPSAQRARPDEAVRRISGPRSGRLPGSQGGNSRIPGPERLGEEHDGQRCRRSSRAERRFPLARRKADGRGSDRLQTPYRIRA